MNPFEAQVREALAIIENGTDYERAHVAAILRNGLRAHGASVTEPRTTSSAGPMIHGKSSGSVTEPASDDPRLDAGIRVGGGSANISKTSKAHGRELGPEEAAKVREAIYGRAGADVGGPSEPAGFDPDAMSSRYCVPRAPATQEAPSGPEPTMRERLERTAAEVRRELAPLIDPLKRMKPTGEDYATRVGSTSPSAPAEPLEALLRDLAMKVAFSAKTLECEGYVQAGKELRFAFAALRAALSVSTSAPKETSEPRKEEPR